MHRLLASLFLVGCTSTLELPEAAGPDAPPPTPSTPLARMSARVTLVGTEGSRGCDLPHAFPVRLELITDHPATSRLLSEAWERRDPLADSGACVASPLAVGDTIAVDVGRMPARVSDVIEEITSNCGGTHVVLETVVDGATKRLHAGGHCFRTTLAVGDTVTVDTILLVTPMAVPDPFFWTIGPTPSVDGYAQVVSPARTITRM